MATADTARLIAALELQDKFTGPLGKADRQLGNFDRKLGTLGTTTQTFGRGIGTAATNLARIGTGVAIAGIGAIAVNVKAGVDSLKELESVTVATNTVLASTKEVSGQSAESIRALAEEYESLNATMDDKVIQAGENMLLTFTNVRGKAFEPALEAALNLNQAMGGGEEGLQSTIIQVGKALNDPVKGVTALRRVGVQLSDAQEDQIKTLVEQNDLYGAQTVILDELTTQFGGQFAAAGDTAEGKMAKLRDTIEDLQMSLAGPLVPVIDRVRDKLIDFLASPRALAAAEQLGDSIAGLFTDANIDQGIGMIEGALDTISGFDFSALDLSFVGDIGTAIGDLPWDSIGNAAELLGTGSKALLDAFLGMPEWVQTAVLTGWGLNKLTGGALGGILGGLTGEIGKWVTQKLGLMTVSAAVVNVNGPAGLPGGKTPPGPKTGGGKIPFLPFGLGALTPIAIPLALSGSQGKEGTMETQQATLQALLDAGLLSEARFQELWQKSYSGVDIGQELRLVSEGTSALKSDSERLLGINRGIVPAVERGVAAQDRVLGATSSLGPRIDAVANTPHNVEVNNDVIVNSSIGVSVLESGIYRNRTIQNITRYETGVF